MAGEGANKTVHPSVVCRALQLHRLGYPGWGEAPITLETPERSPQAQLLLVVPTFLLALALAALCLLWVVVLQAEATEPRVAAGPEGSGVVGSLLRRGKWGEWGVRALVR